jgi:hypothetical protein
MKLNHMNVFKRILATGAALLSLATLPTFAATTIQLGIVGDVQVGTNYMDFGQYTLDPNGAPYTPAPGHGTFEVCLVNAGTFSAAGVTTGEFGNIQSLNKSPGTVTLPGPFMTFDSGGSNLQIWATTIRAGNVGPLVLTHTTDGAVASFNIEGYIFDTNVNEKVALFTGTFSVTFDGTNVTNLITSLPIDAPFSATLTITETFALTTIF